MVCLHYLFSIAGIYVLIHMFMGVWYKCLNICSEYEDSQDKVLMLKSADDY